ncbi:MAG: response regulator [Bacteroidota bacterium]|jgi:two-component system copper resistance phosphate regulon response regulator CusR
MKILVVEDESKTATSLKKGLQENDYDVELAFDGEMALLLCERNKFDLIITDIIIPKINGFDLANKLRQQNIVTPIIMLTAMGLTVDKLKGFDSGTDDYIVKPFDFDELLARIKVLINRSQNNPKFSKSLEYSSLRIDLNTKEVYREGVLINLTAKEFGLLEFFIKNTDRLITKEEIAEKVWDINFDTGTNIIEVYVSYLRNKIDKNFEPKLIHTKKGMGYIFRAHK